MAQRIKPYQWEFGDGNELRFNSNTLPFPPKSLKLFLKDMLKACPINEYADPNYTKLKQLLSVYEKVETNMITITNSGDEAIDIIGKTFLNPGDKFITTPPSYEMFSIQCDINRGSEIEVPLEKESFKVNSTKVIQAAKEESAKIIFLCNPNNPTGSVIPNETIEEIIQESSSIVIVDETYREFYGKTVTPLLQKYENLVILRSFSKFAGIAGARIGYLLANSFLSQRFDAIRFPMGVSYFSYKLAETVLENDQEWISKQVENLKKERVRLTQKLQAFGFIVYPSEANFLLVNVGKNATKLCNKLKRKGLYVRDRSKKKYLDGCLRITIRSKKENEKLLKNIKEVLYDKN